MIFLIESLVILAVLYWGFTVALKKNKLFALSLIVVVFLFAPPAFKLFLAMIVAAYMVFASKNMISESVRVWIKNFQKESSQ